MTTPSTAMIRIDQVAGAPWLLADPPLAMSSTIVPEHSDPEDPPNEEYRPVDAALRGREHQYHGDDRHGLSATPTPEERTCPIACPITASFERQTQ